jgi:hypothetical protein
MSSTRKTAEHSRAACCSLPEVEAAAAAVVVEAAVAAVEAAALEDAEAAALEDASLEAAAVAAAAAVCHGELAAGARSGRALTRPTLIRRSISLEQGGWHRWTAHKARLTTGPLSLIPNPRRSPVRFNPQHIARPQRRHASPAMATGLSERIVGRRSSARDFVVVFVAQRQQQQSRMVALHQSKEWRHVPALRAQTPGPIYMR